MLAFSVLIIVKFSIHMTCFSTVKTIQGIKFIFITKDELTKTQESLGDRFAKAITIPNTKNYHEFIPLRENTIAMKYCSNDQEVATTFSFSNEDKVSDTVNSNESYENVKALYFLAAIMIITSGLV